MFVDEKGVFLPNRATVLLKQGLGEMSRPSEHRGPREMAEFTNILQKWMKENTRLGISILFHEECLHGHAAAKGTSYPQAIALASTWDPGLVYETPRRRSGPAVYSRRSQLGHAAGKRTARLPRVTLDPGETRTVEFTLGPPELSFLNREMQRVVEPGSFKIMIGGSSDDLIETTLNVVARQP
jgi:hypothetical protein